MRKVSLKLGFVFLSVLIAALYASNGLEFISWLIVVFVSVLFHECGHAFTASLCGKPILIELGFLGGTTYFPQEGLKKWQLFLIALNGPLFGIILFFISSALVSSLAPTSIFLYGCKISAFINLFWTVFNLVPILPLDGGQLMRIAFEAIFKNKGLFFSGVLSCIFAVVLALISFLISQYFIGSILFLFAFQNFELIKQARYLSASDEMQPYKKKLEEAAFLFETGKIDEATPLLKTLIEQTKKGMIFYQAIAMLAEIAYMKKEYQELYHLLKPHPKLYENELAALMHEASFFCSDMALVRKLSAEAFQKQSSQDIAFHAAIAKAMIGDKEATLGWLKTALELGLNPDEIKAHPVLKGYITGL